MTPKLITFDCANTLIWTDWAPHTFALRCAGLAGIELPDHAGQVYLQLFQPKLEQFWKINQLRSLEAWRDFWIKQISDWLEAISIEGHDPRELHMLAERQIFETPSSTFKLFDDVIDCLETLRSSNIPMTILSNWDHSLHQCVRAHGIYHYFDHVLASLEEGVEKPDSGFFEIALSKYNFHPAECFHVGDDLVDDFEGAKAMGIPTVLLDRSSTTKRETRTISTLEHLPEAFSWFD